MKKVLQNWAITSGLQSVSLLCNSNLMLSSHFCTDLNKDIFLGIGKYHSMYHRHVHTKHFSEVKLASLAAQCWGSVSPHITLKGSQAPPVSCVPLSGGTSCSLVFPVSPHWFLPQVHEEQTYSLPWACPYVFSFSSISALFFNPFFFPFSFLSL